MGLFDRTPEHDAGAPELADEVEAFVHGRLLDLWGEQPGIETGWLYLNRLAHGDPDEIRELGDMGTVTPERLADAGWPYALTRLADDLTRRCATEHELRDIQRCVLWPLEEELIASTSQLVATPGGLIRLVLSALDSDPRS